MIYQNSVITINKGEAKIDTPIILYRGDREVEINFTLKGSPFRYRSNDAINLIEQTDADYAQLIIKVPNDRNPIFSEITETKKGSVILTITAEMIDEIEELGKYDFQIRLFDSDKTSRATIPPVTGGIEIREPIAIEDEIVSTSNEVNVATANYAVTTTATPLDVFDEDGNYIETTWTDKMLITDSRLNKIEDGITGVNQKIANIDVPEVDLTGYAKKTDIPTKTSQLTNDSDFATNASVDEKIAGIDLSGVDLTGYAKTTDIPTNVSQLTNDANYVNTTQMNEAIANVTGQTVEPSELDMPKVFFYGDALPTTKDNVNLTMDYVSNTTKFSSYIKLKCQGTSSMSYAKKNFTIAMYSDEARETKLKKDFKGWGDQSKFCLKANYVDTTHTRNLSGARIGYDMVASRPDSAFKQQLLTAPRYGVVDGFPIKLYFNGEFYGIYTWNIPKDAWMFNMDESNPNHCVLCAENNNNGNSSVTNSCQFRKAWNGSSEWSVEVGTASDNIKASFDRCINFVMTATDDEFKANIGEYFDLYSLLDYYCFSYLTCHLDGLAKNMLMATYDGVIWGASLYDMDSIYGVYYNGASYVATNYQCPEQYQETNSLLWQRIEACFGAELYARYLELRQGALSLSNIIKHVEEIYDVIPDRVFADEKAKWTSLPQVSTNTMTRFRNYMRDRTVYVDAEMLAIGTTVPCTGIVLSNDTLSFTTTATQTLSVVVSPDNCTDTVVWSVSPTGIATVSNGVVTPVANGTCTITATCGSYSDTCNVTVSGMSESGGDSDVNPNLVFKVDSTSMNTSDNTLTDNIAGISATLTGNPTVSDNQILFTDSDSFSFDISSLNLTSSNRTFRIKFTPTTLDDSTRNLIGIGSKNGSGSWSYTTASYIATSKMVLQHGPNNFSNNTVGNTTGSHGENRLPTSPVTNQEYELVISENIDGNVRWFIDGTLVQDGTSTLFTPLYISNTEGDNRFIGSYSLIEIYNEYCNDYTEFTNMITG